MSERELIQSYLKKQERERERERERKRDRKQVG
jgi:hypothetical protein